MSRSSPRLAAAVAALSLSFFCAKPAVADEWLTRDLLVGEIRQWSNSPVVLEEQAAAREIARNVSEASRGTTDVTSNIVEVKGGASETGSASRDVLTASNELSRHAERMREVVQHFIAGIRAA